MALLPSSLRTTAVLSESRRAVRSVLLVARLPSVGGRRESERVTWGHNAQLDQVLGESLSRAWAAGAGPGDGPVTLDVDSSICETYGLKKQGARFGHTKVRGYHPLVGSVAGLGDVVGVRLRGGNAHSGRGAASFLTQVFNRVRRAGATGPMVLRADSGFYNRNVTAACDKAEVNYSVTPSSTRACTT